MKLCDYGSAKKLDPAETNVNYICSRYYRAPELVFGSSNYTNSIDVWSAGCVIGELILKRPVFPGDTGVDQIVEIMKILGTPSREVVKQMNPLFDAYSFPAIKSTPLHKIFPADTPRDAIDLLKQLLVYEPERRPAPLAALAHPFFDELRREDLKLPGGIETPDMFNFSLEERKTVSADVLRALIPDWFQR